jgi:hypothetical protein
MFESLESRELYSVSAPTPTTTTVDQPQQPVQPVITEEVKAPVTPLFCRKSSGTMSGSM